MIQLLKYSDVLGPYFFLILMVCTFACAVWLITGLRKNSIKHEWFVKRERQNYKGVVIH